MLYDLCTIVCIYNTHYPGLTIIMWTTFETYLFQKIMLIVIENIT